MAPGAFRPTHRAPASGLLAWDAPEPIRTAIGQIAGGAELEILDRRAGWALVGRADGLTGWVETPTLDAVGTPARASPLAAVVVAVVVLALVVGGAFFNITSRTTAGQPNTVNGPPSTASLLATAYESGRIDRPTWLRYRAYSMFGAHALPSEFQSSTPNQDDSALAAELQLGDQLPPDARSELMSYLGRPASAGSVFYGGGPAPTRAGPAAGATLADAVPCGTEMWTKRLSQQHAFTVWAKCTAGFDSRLNTVVNILDGLWPDMTGMMGQPIQDFIPTDNPADYGGDAGLDVYLVPRGTSVTRSGQTVVLDGIDGGLAVAAPPFTGNRSSGYILIDEAATSQPGLRSTLAHELFHILEYANNYRAHWDRVRLHMEANWFAEASAVWAESHFARSSAPSEVYQRVAAFLQNAAMPIDAHGPSGSAEWNHVYQDFMWLFFMEQEAGVKAIGDVWKGSVMEAATDGSQATAAFDEAFPFATHFGDFALRNLDDPQLKSALGRVYQDVDPKFPQFPQSSGATVPPRSGSFNVQLGTGGEPGTISKTVGVDHLSARYFDVSFSSDVDQVSWDVSQLAGGNGLRVNLVVLPLAANPVPKLVPLQGKETQLCDVKQIEAAILVVSDGDLSTAAQGPIAATGMAAPCQSKLKVSSVTPRTVPEALTVSQTSTITITGSGFTTPGLLIDVKISRSDDNVQCPCSVPPQPVLTIVSDTEIDYTAAFSTSAMTGAPYDVTVLDDRTVGSDMPIEATCAACLVLTAPPQ